MQSTTVFGQHIAYYDVGTGPVIVLLHGLGSTAAFDWGTVLPELARTHRVLAMDQIGFGASAKPQVDFSIQTWVDFLGEFLRDRKVDRFTLAGESLGGWIAALYTIESLDPKARPESWRLPPPERLVLADAAGHQHPLPAAFLEHLVPGNLADQQASLSGVFYNKSFVTPEVARKAYESKLAAQDGFTVRSIMQRSAGLHEWVDGRLGAITIPTLVVWGREDEIVALVNGQDYAAKIPGARLVVIPECGHAPMVEKPGEFLKAFLPFVDAK